MRLLSLMIVGSWAACVNYQATGYWNNKVLNNGLPPANSKTYVGLPNGMTPCDLESLQNACVDRINAYRSGQVKFSDGTSDPGVPKPPITAYTQGNRCSNNIAFGDMYLNNGAGGCASAHANAFSCPGGNAGQNTCCFRSGSTAAAIQSQLFSCLQQMWDEGKGLADNTGFSSSNGHWYNMRSTSNIYASCGFAFTSDGGLWMNQDFYSSQAGSQCSCPNGGGVSDNCGGVCYGAAATPAACGSAYVQTGYSVSSCGANTASGTPCGATCAGQFAGSVGGSVSCSNGAYSGSFSGCVPYCPADQGWAATAPGTAATPQPCTAPQVGSTTRMCSSTGAWQSPVVNCQIPATCTDGIQNQDETCVDCGGTVCPACGPCSCVNCGAHGTCTTGPCVCSQGWTGTQCTVPPDACYGVTCQNGGSCVGGVCNCIGGYTGTYCATAPPATCSDGIKNQDEDAIDCGGTKCPACPTYQWVADAWSNCSTTCGGGTQVRNVQCADGKGTIVASSNCASLHPVDLSQSCNIDPCPTFTWITGSYGPCSSPCNSGFQTRTVQCQSSVGPTIVQSGCTTDAVPPSSQVCNTDVCKTYHWVSDVWTDCTVTCGGGTQTRAVTCKDADNTVADNSMCNATQPPTGQACNSQICDSYKWQPCPTFLPCTAQCNGGGSMVGIQYRDVFCMRQSDQTVVDNSLCTDTAPTTALSVCNTQKCTGYNWMANANWGPCEMDSTGHYSRNRTFHCHEADGATALYSDCTKSAGPLPLSRLPCAPGVCSDANGCPLVQIGTLFDFCSKIPSDCIPKSACAVAASEVDDAFSSLGTSATAAATCVDTYNAGLDPADQASQSMIDAVKARLSTGQQVCELVLLSDASTHSLCFASIVLTLFAVFL